MSFESEIDDLFENGNNDEEPLRDQIAQIHYKHIEKECQK